MILVVKGCQAAGTHQHLNLVSSFFSFSYRTKNTTDEFETLEAIKDQNNNVKTEFRISYCNLKFETNLLMAKKRSTYFATFYQ